MSKGWESKNVEEQQAEAQSRAAQKVTDASQARTDAERKRRVQELELQRERVLSEQTSSPHRRSALQAALTSIELELQELGWIVKL